MSIYSEVITTQGGEFRQSLTRREAMMRFFARFTEIDLPKMPSGVFPMSTITVYTDRSNAFEASYFRHV
jgi:hypothetical protein